MKPDSKLASKIESKEFIITAEYIPRASADTSEITASIGHLKNSITAVNVADNHYGIAVSSLAASDVINRFGIEPIYQIVTRDRNRIAIQSDLIGASVLGIRNVLCLSGYHQTLIGCPESANVYDLDSIQLIATVKKMNEGLLIDGSKLAGAFSMLIGAVANPNIKPLELNMIRLHKKVDAGAKFIQTQAVFDLDIFQEWLKTAHKEGITEKTAILASVLPLSGADEAKKLNEKYTDYKIPEVIINRLKSAGDEKAQKKEGLAICIEIGKKLKSLTGIRGIHILSGENTAIVPDIISAIR